MNSLGNRTQFELNYFTCACRVTNGPALLHHFDYRSLHSLSISFFTGRINTPDAIINFITHVTHLDWAKFCNSTKRSIFCWIFQSILGYLLHTKILILSLTNKFFNMPKYSFLNVDFVSFPNFHSIVITIVYFLLI